MTLLPAVLTRLRIRRAPEPADGWDQAVLHDMAEDQAAEAHGPTPERVLRRAADMSKTGDA